MLRKIVILMAIALAALVYTNWRSTQLNWLGPDLERLCAMAGAQDTLVVLYFTGDW